MRVLFMTTTPAPYRVDFFNLLSKRCDLELIYNAMDAGDRSSKWFKNDSIQYKYHVIKEGNFKDLRNVLKKPYDIVIISCYATLNGAYAMRVLKKNKIKFFINADGGIAGNDNFITKFLKTHFISKANYWLSSGNKTTEYFTLYGATRENVYHYPFTSLKDADIVSEPMAYDEKLALRKKYGLECDRLIISVGRFIPVKGIDILLKAFKEVSDSTNKLLLIGGGELREEYEKFLSENNITNVEIIDFISKEELKYYYEMSDFFVFPSRGDIWGLVTNEAMAQGLPMVASKTCISACDLIEPKYLYDTEDVNLLVEKLKYMLSMSNDELRKVGVRNLEEIRKYSIENMVDVHMNIFETVIQIENKKS